MKERKVSSDLRPFVNFVPGFSCQCVHIPAVLHDRCVYDSGRKDVIFNSIGSPDYAASSDASSDILENGIDLGDQPLTSQNEKEPKDLRDFYVDSSKNQGFLLDIVSAHCATGHDPALAPLLCGRSDQISAAPEDLGNDHRAALADDVTLLPCLSNPVTANRIYVGFQGVYHGASSDIKAGSRGFALPYPKMLLGYQEDGLQVDAGVLPLWAEVGLRPYGGPKTVIYYCICPTDLAKQAAFFLKEVTAQYGARQLGQHRAGEAFHDGLVLYNRYPAGARASAQLPEFQDAGHAAAVAFRSACVNLQKTLQRQAPKLRYGGACLEGSPDASLVIYVVPPSAEAAAVLPALHEAALLLDPLHSERGSQGWPGHVQGFPATPPAPDLQPLPPSGPASLTGRYKRAAERTYKKCKGSNHAAWEGRAGSHPPPSTPSWAPHIQVVTESMMGDACAAAGQGLALTVYTKVGGGLAEGAGSYQHRPAFILADLPDPAAPSYPAPRMERAPRRADMDTEAAQSAAASAGEAGQASRSAPPSGLEGEGRDLEGAAASRPRTLHCCYSYRLLEESGPLSLLGDRRDVLRQREFMFIAWTDSIGELLTWRCLAVPPRKMAWQEEKQETGPGPPLGTSMGREPAISHSLKGEEDIAVHVASTVLHETSLVVAKFQGRRGDGVAFGDLVICRLGRPAAGEARAWLSLLCPDANAPAPVTTAALPSHPADSFTNLPLSVLLLECPCPSRLAGCGEKESGALLSMWKSGPDGEDAWGRLGTVRLSWLPPFGPSDAPLIPLETDCVRELFLKFLINRQPRTEPPATEGSVPLETEDEDKRMLKVGNEMHMLAVLNVVMQGLTSRPRGSLGPLGWASATSHLPLHCHTVQSLMDAWACLTQIELASYTSSHQLP